jgi:hypothetical protein
MGRNAPVADHLSSVAANVSRGRPAGSPVALHGPDFNVD